jgi:hypothetical protein
MLMMSAVERTVAPSLYVYGSQSSVHSIAVSLGMVTSLRLVKQQ